jgi:hypothetical protein
MCTQKQCWNISVAILNSTREKTLSSLLLLSLFFNKISEKAEQDLPGTEERRGEKVGEGSREKK